MSDREEIVCYTSTMVSFYWDKRIDNQIYVRDRERKIVGIKRIYLKHRVGPNESVLGIERVCYSRRWDSKEKQEQGSPDGR